MSKKSFVRRIYKNPPIIEAVLDLKFTPGDSFDFAKLDASCREKYTREYPIVLKQVQNNVSFEFSENPALGPVISHEGLRFVSADEKQILQLKTDGFTFSRLKPYEQWESFRDEAKKLLDIYQELALPKNVTRVALRFINRFDFPTSSVDLSEYLNIFPQIPDIYKLNGLAMQVILDQPDIRSTLVISQALIPPARPGVISLLLDFDLFNQESRDFDKLSDFLALLHSKKNEVFESAITDKTREMISC